MYGSPAGGYINNLAALTESCGRECVLRWCDLLPADIPLTWAALGLLSSSVLLQMTMEIEIHRTLSHKHIVGFHDFFEDKNHVYILLELCRRRSLMELHKRRKALTEPEVRYFTQQILLAVCYLHENKVSICASVLGGGNGGVPVQRCVCKLALCSPPAQVIHRDLKLGNLFLNDDLEIKLGDFGLATKVEVEGERKKCVSVARSIPSLAIEPSVRNLALILHVVTSTATTLPPI